ncbi:protein-export chaperone SecB, partial [Lacticaseibacillus paracasei]
IIHEDTDKAELTLNFKVPDDFPFLVEVTITGSFSYVKVEDKTGVGLKNLVQVNGSAILFPYIRAIVSQLTGMANEYTPLLLPTINIGAILAKHSRNESK